MNGDRLTRWTAKPSPAPPQSWREEARRDRLVRAQIDRDREAARAELRITEQRAAAQARLDARQAHEAARTRARQARAARRAALAAWLAAHTTDLLFVPVIAVPAVLAWTAMAAYGSALYGPPGLALPAFSEGAMWAFAAATTVTRHRHPARPVWHLRAGTAVFAAYGAVLNFLHGMTAGHGPHGPVVAVAMALISVAGVTAHQLVTAGPRRSGDERDAARITRAIGRRERAARRAAIRRALVDLDGNGSARLVFAPGAAELTRRRLRVRLIPVAASETDETMPDPEPGGEPERPEPDTVPSPIPSDAETAAMASLRATIAAGNPLSLNQLSSRFKLTRAQAVKVRDLVLASANGHHPEDAGTTVPDDIQ